MRRFVTTPQPLNSDCQREPAFAFIPDLSGFQTYVAKNARAFMAETIITNCSTRTAECSDFAMRTDNATCVWMISRKSSRMGFRRGFRMWIPIETAPAPFMQTPSLWGLMQEELMTNAPKRVEPSHDNQVTRKSKVVRLVRMALH